MTVSREDAIAAAGHVVASYRLLFGDDHRSMDLALLHLHEMLFVNEADSTFPALAMDLIWAAEGVPAWD